MATQKKPRHSGQLSLFLRLAPVIGNVKSHVLVSVADDGQHPPRRAEFPKSPAQRANVDGVERLFPIENNNSDGPIVFCARTDYESPDSVYGICRASAPPKAELRASLSLVCANNLQPAQQETHKQCVQRVPNKLYSRS